MKRCIACGWIACAIILSSAATSVGQQIYQSKKSTLSETEFYTTNFGIFGLNVISSNAGFTVPRGSGLTYIFGSGLWFGAQKRRGDQMNKLVFITYNPNSGASWATPAGADQPATAEQLYHSTDYDRLTGQALKADRDAPWPLWLRADQGPYPSDPGIYELSREARHTGDRYRAPAFMPEVAEQFVARFNDGDLGRYERIGRDTAIAVGYPIGLDIEQNIYAWKTGPFKDMVMIEYAITNISTDTLFNCVASQMVDPDIGNAINDHGAFYELRPELRAGSIWSEQEQGPQQYGVLVTSIVEAPVVDEEGFIDPAARESYQQNGRLGTFRVWPVEEEPMSQVQRYDFISGDRKLDGDYGPGDKRALIGSEKFSMRPGDVAHFTLLFGVVGTRPVELGSKLERLIQTANDAYYNRRSFLVAAVDPPLAGEGGSLVIPNPARDAAMVRFESEAVGRGTLEVTNSLGERVIERDLGRLERGMHDASIDLRGLPRGLYLVRVTTGSATSTMKLTVTR